jgi:hypothetical protein
MAIRVDGQYVEARHISGKSCHEQFPERKFTRDEILANLLGQLNISSSWHCFLALTARFTRRERAGRSGRVQARVMRRWRS